MDHYQILRLSRTASRTEIDNAFHRLMKEADYDSTLNASAIQNAYKVLSDPQRKAAYDNREKEKTVRLQAAEKVKAKTQKAEEIGLKTLIKIFVVLFAVVIAFSIYRFGYLLKTFSQGDVLYFNESNRRVGTIIAIENSHVFAPGVVRDAYLIQVDGDRRIWWTQKDAKSRCHVP